MLDDKTKNINKLQEKIRKEKLDAVFISSVSNITYLTGYANFSKDEREAYLLIGNDFQYIITDGRYSEAIKKQVPHFTLFERGYKNNTEDFLKDLKNRVSNLGIEEVNLTVSEYKLIKKYFKTKNFELSNLRSIKRNEEIKKIEQACEIGDLAFKYIFKKIKTGVSEKEIAYELEHFIKQQSADLSFPPIVAFGKNSSVPHHHTGNTKLEKGGQFVLLDFGVKFENYCSDMTRTVFFGKPSKKQIDMYQTVLTAQQKAVEFINSSIKSGKQIKAQQVDKVARDYIISKGYPTIPHSLGHGIGLEVHEHPYISPKSSEILKEGMVFSIEPGIYIPEFGSPRSTRLAPAATQGATKRTRVEAGGVRIEDLYILKKKSLRQITNSPKNLIIV